MWLLFLLYSVFCLPYLLLPQAGVAAVEAVYAATLLGHPIIAAVMLPSIIFFEIAGVFMSDRTLNRWRSWVAGEEEAMRAVTKQKTPIGAIERLLSVLTQKHILLDLDTADKEPCRLIVLILSGAGAPDEHVRRRKELKVAGCN